MKRRTIAAAVGAFAGLFVAGLALGLPIDPASPPEGPTAVESPSFDPEGAEALSMVPLDAEASSETRAPGSAALPRDLALDETLEVPEPDSAVLLGLGMILLGVVGRRREDAASGF